MLAVALSPALALQTYSARAELVEASSSVQTKDGHPTSSGRAEVGSAVEAERAFARDALKLGQWTAFRKWAAPETALPAPVMFTPQPVNPQTWLKGKADPERAVKWWPTEAWVSCNGFMTVTTGGVLWPDGRNGYFTTVWTIDDPDRPQWRWIVDHGDTVVVARVQPAKPVVRKASCEPVIGDPIGPTPTVPDAPKNGYGASERDLEYSYRVGRDGAREFWVSFWNGKTFETVVHDVVAAPAK